MKNKNSAKGQRKRPIEIHSIERFARKSKPIYEDIRWRFIINLALLALLALMAAEMLMYDQLARDITPDGLEMTELALSMFVLFDLLLVVRYVPDKVTFLKKNWLKAILILPNWIMIKPFAMLGLDHLFPALLSQANITQAGRGVNIFDSIGDFLDKL